jgi:methyl-accepting chemotaxis protein
MNKNTAFSALLITNAIVIAGSVAFSALQRTAESGPAAGSVILSVAPVLLSSVLLALYILYLNKLSENLSSREVDSVYYAGFLITLMVLGAAILEVTFAISGESSQVSQNLLPNTAAKFALGLLVTGIGLYGRIYLQRRILDDETTQNLLNEYADNIGKINDRLKRSAQVVEDELIIVLENARNAGRESTKEMVGVITAELSPAAIALKSTITKINRAFERFEQGKFNELADSADMLSRNISALSDSLKPLEQQLKSQLQTHIDLSSAVGALSDSTRRMIDSADGFSAATSGGVTALDGFSNAVRRSGQVQAELETLSDRIRRSFAEFEASKFSEISERTRKLVEELDSLQAAFTALTGGVDAASTEYQKITVVAQDLANSAQGAVQQIQDLAAAARTGISAIGDFTVAVGTSGAIQEELGQLVESVRRSFSGISEAALMLGTQVGRVAELYTSMGRDVDTESVRQFMNEISRGASVTRAFVDNLQQPISELTKLTSSSTGPLADAVRLLNDTSQKMSGSSADLGRAMVGLATAIRDAATAATRQ